MVNLQVLLGVVEQARADAHFIIMAFQNLEMAASLAAFPEFRVVGQFAERNGPEAEFVIHFHHGRTGRNGEYLRVGEEFAGENEGLLLDAPGDAHSPEPVGDDEARIGHETLSAPGFDIGKSGEFFFVREGDDGFSGKHLLGNIIGAALCNSCPAFLRRNINLVDNLLSVLCVSLIGNHYVEIHLLLKIFCLSV